MLDDICSIWLHNDLRGLINFPLYIFSTGRMVAYTALNFSGRRWVVISTRIFTKNELGWFEIVWGVALHTSGGFHVSELS